MCAEIDRGLSETAEKAMFIEMAAIEDIDEVERLYDAVNDALSAGVNYPEWSKGNYPVRKTAEDGVREGSLFVLRIEGVIAAAVVLNHAVPAAYASGNWSVCAKDSEVLVVHTLAVHPDYKRRGLAAALMDFAKKLALERGLKAIRLDTPRGNLPAIALYEKCGYSYAGTVDLRLGIPGLYWFRLYELAL